MHKRCDSVNVLSFPLGDSLDELKEKFSFTAYDHPFQRRDDRVFSRFLSASALQIRYMSWGLSVLKKRWTLRKSKSFLPVFDADGFVVRFSCHSLTTCWSFSNIISVLNSHRICVHPFRLLDNLHDSSLQDVDASCWWSNRCSVKDFYYCKN